MIHLVVLTGFLGAGKTTLMKRTLEAFSDEKTGVIINEFGSENIDAVLVKKEGIEISELSNGSIFCACIKDKFVDSLIEMSHMDIDYLFIEASGLADPSNMETILSGISHKTGRDYNYHGTICILDGESFLDLMEVLPAVTSQLEYCSAVIINKEDLITPEHLEEVKEKILEYNKDAGLYVTSYCQVDIREIVDAMGTKLINRKPGRETSNTEGNRATTFIARGNEGIPYASLEAFVKDVVGETYRVKGFVATDKGNIEISTVGKNINLLPWDESIKENKIVLISSVGFKLMSTITKGLREHLDNKMHV